jgi:hypothetical protein
MPESGVVASSQAVARNVTGPAGIALNVFTALPRRSPLEATPVATSFPREPS